jgi:hypothetical protein
LTNSIFFVRAEPQRDGIPLLDRVFIEIRAMQNQDQNFEEQLYLAMDQIQNNEENLVEVLP